MSQLLLSLGIFVIRMAFSDYSVLGLVSLQVSDYISNSSYALDENANLVESINLVCFL